jgi:hypothetical protein
MSSDRVDPSEVGESMLQLLRDYIERSMRFRASKVSRSWIDVRFPNFIRNPLGEIERVYEAAGLEISVEAQDGMSRWIEEHPRKDLQRARPADLAPYGVDPDRARAIFRDYCQTYGVEFDGI